MTRVSTNCSAGTPGVGGVNVGTFRGKHCPLPRLPCVTREQPFRRTSTGPRRLFLPSLKNRQGRPTTLDTSECKGPGSTVHPRKGAVWTGDGALPVPRPMSRSYSGKRFCPIGTPPPVSPRRGPKPVGRTGGLLVPRTLPYYRSYFEFRHQGPLR